MLGLPSSLMDMRSKYAVRSTVLRSRNVWSPVVCRFSAPLHAYIADETMSRNVDFCQIDETMGLERSPDNRMLHPNTITQIIERNLHDDR